MESVLAVVDERQDFCKIYKMPSGFKFVGLKKPEGISRQRCHMKWGNRLI